MNNKILKSNLDDSVNFVTEVPNGKIECRFVQRRSEYFTLYLSSHIGCNKGCKFCWLTQEKKQSIKSLNLNEYLDQAKTVLEYASKNAYNNTEIVNYAFMSRGEFFANRNILNGLYPNLSSELNRLAYDAGFIPEYSISTIMPKEISGKKLTDILGNRNPNIYYSLYSMDYDFRNKWLPGAIDPNKALGILKQYQQSSGKKITLHWAFIEGENDGPDDIFKICEVIKQKNLKVVFNCVRYNSHSNLQYKESSIHRIRTLCQMIKDELNCQVKIVSRVGEDVAASCGMFV